MFRRIIFRSQLNTPSYCMHRNTWTWTWTGFIELTDSHWCTERHRSESQSWLKELTDSHTDSLNHIRVQLYIESTVIHWDMNLGLARKDSLNKNNEFSSCLKWFTDSNISKQGSESEFWSKWFIDSSINTLMTGERILVMIKWFNWIKHRFALWKRSESWWWLKWFTELNTGHGYDQNDLLNQIIRWIKQWFAKQERRKSWSWLKGFTDSKVQHTVEDTTYRIHRCLK